MEKVKIDLRNAKKLETRIIARGEVSNHAHAVVGDAALYELDGSIIVDVYGEAAIKHILESEFQNGNEVWTKEHTDIKLDKGQYKFVQQVEYNPYEAAIQQVRD